MARRKTTPSREERGKGKRREMQKVSTHKRRLFISANPAGTITDKISRNNCDKMTSPGGKQRFRAREPAVSHKSRGEGESWGEIGRPDIIFSSVRGEIYLQSRWVGYVSSKLRRVALRGLTISIFQLVPPSGKCRFKNSSASGCRRWRARKLREGITSIAEELSNERRDGRACE